MLEAALGIRFQAFGGRESLLLGKPIDFFGTPGARRLPDAGPRNGKGDPECLRRLRR